LIGGPNDVLIESEIVRVESRDAKPRDKEVKEPLQATGAILAWPGNGAGITAPVTAALEPKLPLPPVFPEAASEPVVVAPNSPFPVSLSPASPSVGSPSPASNPQSSSPQVSPAAAQPRAPLFSAAARRTPPAPTSVSAPATQPIATTPRPVPAREPPLRELPVNEEELARRAKSGAEPKPETRALPASPTPRTPLAAPPSFLRRSQPRPPLSGPSTNPSPSQPSGPPPAAPGPAGAAVPARPDQPQQALPVQPPAPPPDPVVPDSRIGSEPAPAPQTQNELFESLEEEMAKLLGRQPNP
jgi:hypothetical protein